MKASLIWGGALLLASTVTGCQRQQARRAPEYQSTRQPDDMVEHAETIADEEADRDREREPMSEMGPRDMEPKAQAPSTPPEPQTQSGMQAQVQEACPMNLPDVQVTVQNIRQGVAYDFATADQARVEEVRDRVEKMAEIYGEAQGSMSPGQQPGMQQEPGMRQQPGMQQSPSRQPGMNQQQTTPQGTPRQQPGMQQEPGMQGTQRQQPGMQQGSPSTQLPTVETNVVETQRGARLELRAERSQDVSRLRQRARQHANVMTTERRCPVVEQRIEGIEASERMGSPGMGQDGMDGMEGQEPMERETQPGMSPDEQGTQPGDRITPGQPDQPGNRGTPGVPETGSTRGTQPGQQERGLDLDESTGTGSGRTIE